LRDFDAAEAWLEKAMAIRPDRPWLWVVKSSLLEGEDRYDECLAAAQKALELRPGYRPGVQAAAHALQLLDREEEALAMLSSAAAACESAPVAAQLAMLQFELCRYDEAAASFDLCERLSPLIEKAVRKWLASRRSDIAAARGDVDAAIEQAKLVDDPFHKQIVENLSRPEAREAKRVLLPVGFVRQHHMTCGPATLTAISRFWSMPADHLAVVEDICYDGTAYHSERNWAQTHGWEAREFTITWEAAVALIDREVPFTLTTVEPGNSHLQAVVGYDARRRTLLIRDPYIYHVHEMMAAGMMERYRSTGPRGMALVPKDRANLLDGIDLKDAALWDKFHAVQRALYRHDRETASFTCDELDQLAPDHQLAANSRRSLSGYDGDTVSSLASIERLLSRFPDDANLLLAKLSCLRALGRQQDCLEILRPMCEGPKARSTDPLFWQMYANEMGRDARQHNASQRLLRRSIRRRQRDASGYSLLGNILWDQGRREQATELYHFSACLEEKQESFSRTYFIAARHLRRTTDAIRHLRERFDRFGKASGRSVRTLFWALEETAQTEEAFRVLDQAISLRPDDGELLLHAATCNARYGRFDVAQTLMDRSAGKSPAPDRLRASAELASLKGDLRSARDLWQEVCRLQPLDVDAHARVARLLSETESTEAALEHLRSACTKFPHHYGMRQLLLTWLRDEAPPQDAEPWARQLVESFPDDCWARRELTITLLRQQRPDDALPQIETALRIDPSDAQSHALLGRLHLDARRTDAARDAFREAIRRSVDNDYAIAGLFDACDTTSQKRESLDFLLGELRRQTIFGDGLIAYRNRASELLSRDKVLTTLREALEARSDLWQAHSAVVQQLTTMDRLDDAWEASSRACERFPLLPPIWLDRAELCRARGDAPGQVAALEKAVQISPGYGFAVRELSGAYDHTGNPAKARALLEQAIARSPLDPFNHGCLADVLWKTGHREEAIEAIRKAVNLGPGYDWGWSALRRWAGEMNRPDLVEEAARDLAARRPGEARSWMMLAESLTGPHQLDERLTAVEQAISRSPRTVGTYDLKARILAAAGRTDEALAACKRGAFGTNGDGEIPAQLRMRHSIIRYNSGKREDALAELRQIVQDAPHHFGAWMTLVEWERASDDNSKYLSAARQLASLFPQDPRAHGYLGEACERAKDRAAAKAAFGRAMRMSPDYSFAGFSLFDLHLKDNELDAARQALDTMRGQVEPELLTMREVQLACARKDPQLASAKLLELCTLPFTHGTSLDLAVEAMQRAKWSEQIEQTFAAASERPDINPLVGGAWMALHTNLKRFKSAEKLFGQLAARNSKLLAEAGRRLVEDAGKAKQKKLVTGLLATYGRSLHGNDAFWGAAGYALTSLQLWKQAITWMSDWSQRPETGAPAWALSNLGLCLRRSGQDATAAEVTSAALARPADGTRDSLRAWAAADRALAGETDAAATELQSIDSGKLDAYYRFVYHASQSLCAAAAIEEANRKEQVRKARFHLERAESCIRISAKTPELRRLRKAALKMVSRRCGIRTPAWCWQRRLGLTVPALVPSAPRPMRTPEQKRRELITIAVIILGVIIGALGRMFTH
jgi:tetratricopeptide (TPR) repeat protein